MTYSTGVVAHKLNISKDTIYYYEKAGLLPPIKRDNSGHRVYFDSDVEWIFLICRLRDTDMTIKKIKKYVSLLMNGGRESISERQNILLEHKMHLNNRIKTYQELLQLVDKKVAFYDDVLNFENPETIKCMDYTTEWEHFRSILGGANHG